MSDRIQSSPRISDRTFDAVALVLLFLAYFAVFWIVRRDAGLGSLVIASLTNLAPLIPLALASRYAIRRWAIGQSLLRQLVAHIALAALFTLAWHWLILILIGMREGTSLTEFTVSAFFPEPALAWQFLQGMTVYTMIAAITYMRAQPDMSGLVESVGDTWPEPEAPLQRYFIRLGDDIQPIDIATIISIIGADDYAEVTTSDGQHLVRTTLSKFEASLDQEQFLRVHRSRIVNINMIDHAEPAGDGRMILHMTNGESIQTSRTGAKALRNRVL